MLLNPAFLSSYPYNSTLPAYSVSATQYLSCLCGHVFFTVDMSLVDLYMHQRGYTCGQECDRVCEWSNPCEAWHRFSLVACQLPLKIISTTSPPAPLFPCDEKHNRLFFLNLQTTYIWENFENDCELFYIQSIPYTFLDEIISVGGSVNPDIS